MAKLKVFAAQMGFFETVVAAPSKAAALKAWGAHQDLFATGMAKKADDAKACEAALAAPGVVLRRAVGAGGGFTEAGDVAGLKLPKVKPPKTAKGEPGPKPVKPKKPPSRKALTAAEEAIAARKARYEAEREALDARRRALDAEAEALRQAFEDDRRRLDGVRAKAAEEYRRAGG